MVIPQACSNFPNLCKKGLSHVALFDEIIIDDKSSEMRSYTAAWSLHRCRPLRFPQAIDTFPCPAPSRDLLKFLAQATYHVTVSIQNCVSSILPSLQASTLSTWLLLMMPMLASCSTIWFTWWGRLEAYSGGPSFLIPSMLETSSRKLMSMYSGTQSFWGTL